MLKLIVIVLAIIGLCSLVKAEDKTDSWGSSLVEFGKDSGKLLSKTGKDAALATKVWVYHTKGERKDLAESTGKLAGSTLKATAKGVVVLGGAVVSGLKTGASVVAEAQDSTKDKDSSDKEFSDLLEDK